MYLIKARNVQLHSTKPSESSNPFLDKQSLLDMTTSLICIYLVLSMITNVCKSFSTIKQMALPDRKRLASLRRANVATFKYSTELKLSSFSQFIQVESNKRPGCVSVYRILDSIQRACKEINALTRRVSLDKLGGIHRNISGSEVVNVQGEVQHRLDVVSNQIMKDSVCRSCQVAIVVSEEDEKPCVCSDVISGLNYSDDYVVVFDPLDGSSNVDSGLPTGTIFGIYRSPKGDPPCDPVSTAMQSGTELVAAGYCLYSASTHLVVTLRPGVFMFTLDDQTGEFRLTQSDVRIPPSGRIYSLNDAHSCEWSAGLSKFVQDFKSGAIPAGAPKRTPSARYIGALVADAHNVLLHGGVFGYPSLPSMPAGKLRLVYEANPLAALVEDAGGLAVNGPSRILDLVVNDIHQRTPLFIGSKDIISALQSYVY